jgi:hypothetical protein
MKKRRNATGSTRDALKCIPNVRNKNGYFQCIKVSKSSAITTSQPISTRFNLHLWLNLIQKFSLCALTFSLTHPSPSHLFKSNFQFGEPVCRSIIPQSAHFKMPFQPQKPTRPPPVTSRLKSTSGPVGMQQCYKCCIIIL